jgi:putative endonuclease
LRAVRPLGGKGEDLAVRFLKKKGYRIISKNFKTPLGEIDIIAEDGLTLVFVEVKTRSDDSFGHPFEAVNYRKKEKLRRVALWYLKQAKKEMPSRFDVVSIQTDGDTYKIEHIIDAFE